MLNEKTEDVVIETTPEVIESEVEKINDDSLKTYEELKAEAESAEAKLKELKKEETDEEKRHNMIVRRNKAIEKTEVSKPIVVVSNDDLETRDLITLVKNDIAEDSEKAKILEKYKKGGLITSYADGLKHTGILAEFNALEANKSAKNVIDENDTDDVKIRTTKEVINNYRNDGQVPSDVKLQKAIAEDNLKKMGIN